VLEKVLRDPMDLKAEDISLTIEYKLSKGMVNLTIESHLVAFIFMKLNRELLPIEKSTKEKMPAFSESWVRHDIDLKRWAKCGE
jgi:hypothetical protein